MTQFYVDSEQPHLGGYIVGGDPATYYPKLWDWFVKVYGIRSVVDVGCGEGHAIDYFATLGCRVLGIDGVEQNHPEITCHDYTQAPMAIRDPYDLVWSCEFVEHIEEKYVPNFVQTFTRAPLVLMTHAEPGQPGHHHVNCQTADYWRGVMAAAGYLLDVSLTKWARSLAAMTGTEINHFARSGLAFVRS